MDWLNYHHLLYFWTVVREGTVARAAQRLSLAQPTVSAQVKALEHALGVPLFDRHGRRLMLTDAGRRVHAYAEEIFGLGRELLAAVRGGAAGRVLPFVVGVADVVPKLVAYRILRPALGLPEPVRLVLREAPAERLLAELSTQSLDLVLTDAPIPPQTHVRAFHHLLGESDVTFFAAAPLARRLRIGFPGSLAGAPLLLPAKGTSLRRGLDDWLDREGIRPRVVGEFDDSALLKSFGEGGAGVFAAPSVIEAEVRRQYRVQALGRTDRVRERFYAISLERRLRHAAVVAITDSARKELFG